MRLRCFLLSGNCFDYSSSASPRYFVNSFLEYCYCTHRSTAGYWCLEARFAEVGFKLCRWWGRSYRYYSTHLLFICSLTLLRSSYHLWNILSWCWIPWRWNCGRQACNWATISFCRICCSYHLWPWFRLVSLGSKKSCLTCRGSTKTPSDSLSSEAGSATQLHYPHQISQDWN